MQLQKILVPTDFSELSGRALKVAFELAVLSGSSPEVVLVHVIDLLPSVYGPLLFSSGIGFSQADLQKRLLAYAQEQCWQQLSMVAADIGYDKYRSIVLMGQLQSMMLECMEEEQPDCIVLPAYGISFANTPGLAIDLSKLVRYAACPVFLVRHDFSAMQVQRMVYAASFEEDIAPKVMPLLKYWQSLLKAELLFLRVNTPTDFLTSRDLSRLFAQYKENYGLKAELHIYCALNQDEGILSFARDIEVDLIVLATHQRRGVSHFFMGSVAEKVMECADYTVMSFGLRNL